MPDSDLDTRRRRYSTVAIVLHWLIALALAFQLALGFAMPKDASGFAAYQLHKSVGIVILLLTLARLAWRIARRPPPALEHGIGGVLARLVHAGFYLVLILGPLTGWLLVSTAPARVPTLLFGTVPWPHLPAFAGLYDPSMEAHEILGWVAIGLFVLHVAGAVRHQLILRDRLLERMAPAGSASLATALAALVVIVGAATFALGGGLRPAPVTAAEAVTTEAPTGASIAVATGADQATETEEPTEPGAADEARPDAAADDGPPPTWAIQPGGRLGFAVSDGGDTIDGTFARWSGTIAFDPDHPESAEIAIDVDLASASVGDGTMTEMLRGADFLAVAANPRATWRATSIRQTGAGRYVAQGSLTLKGVSRLQALAFTLSGTGARRTVRGSATIDRTAFGVGTGSSAENLGSSVSLDVAFDAVSR